jgi:serine phosphatase RsbU (regulator of sigma subunit)/energy-coupling factor transporter ATP-binding protein EcfA2
MIVEKKTKTIAVTGIDGSGKSTVIQRLVELFPGSSGNIQVMNCPEYHNTENAPLGNLSRQLDAFTKVSDQMGNFQLKGISIYLQATLFGIVQNFFIDTFRPEILVNERHAVIDSVAYGNFYCMLMQRSLDRDTLEDELKSKLEEHDKGAYDAIINWVDLSSSRLSNDFDFWGLTQHLLKTFSLPQKEMIEEVKKQFQSDLPDVLILLDAQADVASARVNEREDNKELHEKDEILEQIRKAYFNIIKYINSEYHEVKPGLLISIFMLSLFIGIIYSIVLLLKHYKKENEKSMLPIIVMSILFYFFAGADIMNASGLFKFVYLLEYAFMLFILSMTYALLNRFVDLHETIETLNAGLEINVKERTEELQSAMEELKVINKELVSTRDALWGEMQLAKKIQTVLLPPEPKIPGFQLSAYMMPAEEVGGDYYDIINTNKNDWILIGDVSGHGVPAGLIMMMAQSSIRSHVMINPDIAPSDLLDYISTAIRYNIQYLNEERFMTITALSYNKDDEIVFSGKHEDILIYRSNNNEVEEIKTDGICISKMDLGNKNKNLLLKVNPGDIIVLFTDGLIEAREKNQQEKMLGQEKLIHTLKKCCNQSTEEIKEELINMLNNYFFYDDVTFLILKKLLD